MPKRRPKTRPAATARTVSSATESARGAAALMENRMVTYRAHMSHNLRRDLGVVESYAALLGMLIGAGIFKVTGVAWELTGPSVILTYLVLAPAVLATSVAYSVFVSTPLGREPGGEYTHISRVFGGYGLAFVDAWLKVISYIGALAYLARAFGDYVRQLFGGRGDVVVIAVGS